MPVTKTFMIYFDFRIFILLLPHRGNITINEKIFHCIMGASRLCGHTRHGMHFLIVAACQREEKEVNILTKFSNNSFQKIMFHNM